MFFESPQRRCSAASTPTSSTLRWIRAAQSRKKYIFRTGGLLHAAVRGIRVRGRSAVKNSGYSLENHPLRIGNSTSIRDRAVLMEMISTL
jgi:hypothetical protein